MKTIQLKDAIAANQSSGKVAVGSFCVYEPSHKTILSVFDDELSAFRNANELAMKFEQEMVPLKVEPRIVV